MSKSNSWRSHICRKFGYRCHYCGREMTTLSVTRDHVVPRCRMEPYLTENIVGCCYRCNGFKMNLTVEEFRSRLIKKSDTITDRWHRQIIDSGKFFFERQAIHTGGTD